MRLRKAQMAKLVPGWHKRTMMGLFDLTKMVARNCYQPATMKAGKVIMNLFVHVSPALLANRTFERSTQYQKFLIRIQGAWKVKYSARMLML